MVSVVYRGATRRTMVLPQGPGQQQDQGQGQGQGLEALPVTGAPTAQVGIEARTLDAAPDNANTQQIANTNTMGVSERATLHLPCAPDGAVDSGGSRDVSPEINGGVHSGDERQPGSCGVERI
jgi:hypothetical protein